MVFYVKRSVIPKDSNGIVAAVVREVREPGRGSLYVIPGPVQPSPSPSQSRQCSRRRELIPEQCSGFPQSHPADNREQIKCFECKIHQCPLFDWLQVNPVLKGMGCSIFHRNDLHLPGLRRRPMPWQQPHLQESSPG